MAKGGVISSTQKHQQKRKQQRAEKYKKFIGNKADGEGFADLRKKKMLHEYHKMLQKEKVKNVVGVEHVKKIYAEEEKSEIEPSSNRRKPTKKISAYHKAKLESETRKEEQQQKQQEFSHKQKQRDEALEKYQKQKKAKYKKIAKKNYKGQPNMASQMDLLLSQIQSK